jgi:hypothetical protein
VCHNTKHSGAVQHKNPLGQCLQTTISSADNPQAVHTPTHTPLLHTCTVCSPIVHSKFNNNPHQQLAVPKEQCTQPEARLRKRTSVVGQLPTEPDKAGLPSCPISLGRNPTNCLCTPPNTTSTYTSAHQTCKLPTAVDIQFTVPHSCSQTAAQHACQNAALYWQIGHLQSPTCCD